MSGRGRVLEITSHGRDHREKVQTRRSEKWPARGEAESLGRLAVAATCTDRTQDNSIQRTTKDF
jgi:hypothetical protein